jgi:hypothetical protein
MPAVRRVEVPMNQDYDPDFDTLVQANRQAIDKLRSLTEDLAAVVEHEKRLVEDISPILEPQNSVSAINNKARS